MSYSQQNNVNILNQTLTLVQNNYHFHIAINERDSVKEKIEKIQEQFHSIEKDIEIGDGSDLNKKFKEIWQAISYLIKYDKLVVSSRNKGEEYTNYLNMIKSISAIIDLYRTHCQKFNVDINIIDGLKKLADDLFKKCSKELDENFWFRHKIYHYFLKRGLSQKDENEYNKYSIYDYLNHKKNDYLSVCNLVIKYEDNQYADNELKSFFDEYSNDTLLEIFGGILKLNHTYYDNKKYFSFNIFKNAEENTSPNYISYFFNDMEQFICFAMDVEIQKLNQSL